VNELSGSVEDYEDFMQALTEVSPVPITYENIDRDISIPQITGLPYRRA
jgi:hypothetical protein